MQHHLWPYNISFGPEITSIASLGQLLCMSVLYVIPADEPTVRHFTTLLKTLARERSTVRVLIDGRTLSVKKS